MKVKCESFVSFFVHNSLVTFTAPRNNMPSDYTTI